MSGRPDDIPEDVWRIASDEALKYVEWIDPPPVEGAAAAEHVLAFSFSRLILAERERCAKIADEIGASYGEDEPRWFECCETVAMNIRRGDA